MTEIVINLDCHVFCTINRTFKQPWKALFSLGYTTSQKKQVTENHHRMDFNVLSSERKSAAGHPCLFFKPQGEWKVSTLHRFFKQVYGSALCFFTAYGSGGLFLVLQTPLMDCQGPCKESAFLGAQERRRDKFAGKSSKMPIHVIATFEDKCINC